MIKAKPRAFRWSYQNGGGQASNSLTQHGARECKANLQDVVFWATQKVLDCGPDGRHELLARGGRQRWLLIVRYLDGWTWRLHDGRKVFFQPVMERGLDDEIEALFHFQSLRESFESLDSKATHRVQMPPRTRGPSR